MGGDFQIYPFKFTGDLKRVHELKGADFIRMLLGNIGNLAFQYPLRHIISGNIHPWSSIDSYLKVCQEVPLVITAANWIAQKKSSSGISDELMRAVRGACSTAVFGLGAQAPLGTDPRKFAAGIEPDVQDSLRELGDMVKEIGVRDIFTMDVLDKLGVSNVSVLGCVSIFSTCDRNVERAVMNKCDHVLEGKSSPRITVNEYTPNPYSKSDRRRDLQATLAFLDATNAHYVLQGRHCLPYYFGEGGQFHALLSDVLDEHLANKLKTVLSDRSLIFSRIEDWISYYRTRDLVIGTRIHGAVLAIQAGTPSVVITHDSRTEGLAISLGIPFIRAAEFADGTYGVKEFLLKVKEDIAGFNRNRSYLASRWEVFLKDSGIELTDYLRRIGSIGDA